MGLLGSPGCFRCATLMASLLSFLLQWPKITWGGKVCLPYRIQSKIKGRGGKNLEEKLRQRSPRNATFWLASRPAVDTFLRQLRHTCLGIEPPSGGCAFLHQLAIKKMYIDIHGTTPSVSSWQPKLTVAVVHSPATKMSNTVKIIFEEDMGEKPQVSWDQWELRGLRGNQRQHCQASKPLRSFYSAVL